MAELTEPDLSRLPILPEEPADPISPADANTMMTSHGISGPYALGPDSTYQEGVPRGELTQYHAVSKTIYPGIGHDYWVYVPAQYSSSEPACLMVFQDGPLYLAPEANIPAAFDN